MEVFDESELQEHFDSNTAEVVGRGGLGHVQIVVNNKTGEKFALKTQPKGVSKRRNANIKREKVALQALDHRNIVKLIAIFEGKQYVYFLMELMSSRDLWDWCKSYCGLPMPSVKYYGAEIVLALEYLRSKGFVHRDMKSRNVLMSHDNHVKLGDFGTARLISDRFGHVLALAGEEGQQSQCGTRKFMAPEVMQKKNCTYSTDLWGLAVILSEMYCGEWCCMKLESESYQDYWRRIEKGDFEIEGFPVPDPNLKNLIERLTRHNPCMRIGATNMVELKFHSFFFEINFGEMKRIPPPPLPNAIPKAKSSKKMLKHVHPGFSIEEGTKTYEDGTMFASPPPKHPKDANDSTMFITSSSPGHFEKMLAPENIRRSAVRNLSASFGGEEAGAVGGAGVIGATGGSSLALESPSDSSDASTTLRGSRDSEITAIRTRPSPMPPSPLVRTEGMPMTTLESKPHGGARPKVRKPSFGSDLPSSGRSPMATLPSYTNIGLTQPQPPAPIYTQSQATAPVYTQQTNVTATPVYTQTPSTVPIYTQSQTTAPLYTQQTNVTNTPLYTQTQPTAPIYTQSQAIAPVYPQQTYVTPAPIYTQQSYVAPAPVYTQTQAAAPEYTQQSYMNAPTTYAQQQPSFTTPGVPTLQGMAGQEQSTYTGSPGVPVPVGQRSGGSTSGLSLSSLQISEPRQQAPVPQMRTRQKSMFPFPQGKPKLQTKGAPRSGANPLALDSQLRRIFDQDEWSKAKSPNQSPSGSRRGSPRQSPFGSTTASPRSSPLQSPYSSQVFSPRDSPIPSPASSRQTSPDRPPRN